MYTKKTPRNECCGAFQLKVDGFDQIHIVVDADFRFPSSETTIAWRPTHC